MAARGREGRQAQVQAKGKQSREAQQFARRGLVPAAKNAKGQSKKAPVRAKRGRGAARGRGGRGGTRTKSKPMSQDDLDKEMDTYWFKAGKGPNPDEAALDRDMDDYWAKK